MPEGVSLPILLTPTQAANEKLERTNPEPNDKGLYTYTCTDVADSSASPIVPLETEPKLKVVLKVKPDPKAGAKEASPLHTLADAASNGAVEPSRNRKWNFGQMEEGFQEAAAHWAQVAIEKRLMGKKRKKQYIVNRCPDFDILVLVDTKKRWMAQELARSMLHSTDDEDE